MVSGFALSIQNNLLFSPLLHLKVEMNLSGRYGFKFLHFTPLNKNVWKRKSNIYFFSLQNKKEYNKDEEEKDRARENKR